MKDNEIKSEIEEAEVQTNAETSEIGTDTKGNAIEAAINNEVQSLISEEINDKESAGKVVLANALDQLVLVACSCLLVMLFDLILNVFGYMLVRDNGALIFAGGIIYFILNCIYVPVMEKTKLKNTIAKKILSL